MQTIRRSVTVTTHIEYGLCDFDETEGYTLIKNIVCLKKHTDPAGCYNYLLITCVVQTYLPELGRS